MSSHAGSAAEVAHMKFVEDMLFTVRSNATRVSGLPQGESMGSWDLSRQIGHPGTTVDMEGLLYSAVRGKGM